MSDSPLTCQIARNSGRFLRPFTCPAMPPKSWGPGQSPRKSIFHPQILSKSLFLYAFQNEKRVFTTAHHAGKQVAVIAAKGGSTKRFHARFRMGVGDSPEGDEIPDDLLRLDAVAMPISPEDIAAYSPKALCVVELRSRRDLDIFLKESRSFLSNRGPCSRLGHHLCP